MAIVYKITNKYNNKCYIGMTVRTLDQRWNSHVSAMRQGSKFRFHAAIRKYGVDSWNKCILEESDDINYIRKMEEYYIEKNKSNTLGYNAKPGGCGGWIVKPSNYKNWKTNCSAATRGKRNPRYSGLTNEIIIETALEICKNLGYIPHKAKLYSILREHFSEFPKTMNGDFRKPIKYSNLSKHIQDITGLEIYEYIQTSEHRNKIKLNHIGRSWWHSDECKKNTLCHEKDLDKTLVWKKGRKKWD